MGVKASFSAVYAIIHWPTNRRYVGSAINLVKRLREHRAMLKAGSHHSRYLQNAWNKYGPKQFVFQILERCEPLVLLQREQAHLNSVDRSKLFNICLVAGSALGIKRQPITKQRISQALTGRKFSQAHRASMSAARLGVSTGPHSEEVKAKISAAAKTIANSEEGRKLRSERAKAMHAAGRIRYHRRRLGKFKTCSGCGVRFINARRPDGTIPQYKLCKSCREDYRPPGCPKGYRHTPEARRKISEAAKKMWQQVNSRALFDEGRPKANYPGGGTCL